MSDWLTQTQALANDLFVDVQYASLDKLPAVFAEPPPIEFKAEGNFPEDNSESSYPLTPVVKEVSSTEVI